MIVAITDIAPAAGAIGKPAASTFAYLENESAYFALLFDDEYNRQHLGGKLVLKSPIGFFTYDPWGEKPPTAFGYMKGTWTRFNQKLRGGQSEPPVRLLYDAILAPDGVVFGRDGDSYGSIDEWLKARAPQVEVEIVEWPGVPEGHPSYRRNHPNEFSF